MVQSRKGEPTARRRREDPLLLRGSAHFVDDLDIGPALHVAFVRSPHAHAEIAGIDAAAAAALPGVVGVFSWDDLGPAGRTIPPLVPHPAMYRPVTYGPLARDRVRYVGEPVAAVVAVDRYVAEDAAELVAVDYRPLPAVADVDSATAAGAPCLFPDLGSNVLAEHREVVGDPDRAFAEAAHVFRAELHIARGSGQPMETRGVAAAVQEDGTLHIWDATQTPHRVRRYVADLLGVPHGSVRVTAPAVGGGFGTKGCIYPEELFVPWAARRLGRAVKWIEDRREHLTTATQDREQRHRIELALDGDGRFLALRVRFDHDLGAYAPYGLVVCQNTIDHLSGTYRIPHLDVGFRAVLTNRPPTGPTRGAGRPQGNFVIERTIDLAARALGFDAAELRRRNFVRPEDLPYNTGLGQAAAPVIYDSGDYRAAYDEAWRLLREQGWVPGPPGSGSENGPYVGVGVVPYIESCGGQGFEEARVEVLADGRVHVATGAAPQGQGQHTMLADLVADVLRLRREQVVVTTGDTAGVPDGVGTFASRSTIMAGSAVYRASNCLRRKLLTEAARVWECRPDDVALEDGRLRLRGVPDRTMTLAELHSAVASAVASHETGEGPGSLSAFTRYDAAVPAFAHGAHGCVVGFDPATCELKILAYVIVHDAGRVLEPEIVDGQVLGGLAHGLSSMLYERVVHDAAGQPLTASFMDYLLVTAPEMPVPVLVHTESPSPGNPLGVKGAGEGGAVPVHAVLAQALENALDRRRGRVDGEAAITHAPLLPDHTFTRFVAAGDAAGAG